MTDTEEHETSPNEHAEKHPHAEDLPDGSGTTSPGANTTSADDDTASGGPAK
ncbi:hypothetical protein [Subtercola sp. YIM 133946]|uniref:hypothetical protein n=1 Tax=Subtercola sp. YIM 133946 TaxID=3118909 RepID=UPI002F923503